MLKRPITADELARLREECDQADRRYNEALTALDRAKPRFEAGGAPIPPYDDSQVAPLNERWKILEHTSLPPVRGLRSRLAHFVWGLIGPVLERQQTFNSTLVDHVNRTVGTARASQQAAEVLAAHVAALVTCQWHLMAYLQQLTSYVDTKDRLVAGSLVSVYDAELNTHGATLSRQDGTLNEYGATLNRHDGTLNAYGATLNEYVTAYRAGLNGLTDELLMRWESLSAREARFDGKVSATAAAYEDLRASLATVQQSTSTIKRELERVLAGEPSATTGGAAPSLDSYKYVGFEDRFRGSQTDISARLESYVPLFAGARDVLDVGCGRGELLELLRTSGVPARGIELNHEMAETCRARGLDVAEGDLLSYLEGLPDGSLGGLIAIQVVEHLEPDYLMRALDVAYHKLRPGARIVLETINPACWFAFFASYVRDLTHVRPLHPETLTYLLTASGFSRVRAEYRSPYPESDKLQKVAPAPDTPQADLADTLNGNTERLNALLFTYMDYAAIGERG